MKVGDTGTFFRPGIPPNLGEFFKCRVIEIRGEKLLVELDDGSKGDIQAAEFTPQYMVTSNADVTGLAPAQEITK